MPDSFEPRDPLPPASPLHAKPLPGSALHATPPPASPLHATPLPGSTLHAKPLHATRLPATPLRGAALHATPLPATPLPCPAHASIDAPTHTLVAMPLLPASALAGYMVASETARRSLIRACKYPPLARPIRHDAARAAVGELLGAGTADPARLQAVATMLLGSAAGSPAQRALATHNAEYVARLATVLPDLAWPARTCFAPGGATGTLALSGVRVTLELAARLRRTRGTRLRTGAVMLRYAKGRALDAEEAAWQAALLLTSLRAADADPRLCLVVDAWAGVAHTAPSDAVRRFGHMAAACASIAERWDRVPPPAGAVVVWRAAASGSAHRPRQAPP